MVSSHPSGADSFAGLATTRRKAHWATAAVDVRAQRDLPLFAASEGPLIAEEAPALREERAGEAVVSDYRATGLTLRQHPLALLRPALNQLGLHDTRKLKEARQGQAIRLPGMVLMRQRPGTARGVVFITVEDEWGEANLVVYANVGARDRAALIGARLLVTEGRVERTDEHAEVPILHLIARKLTYRSDLLDRLGQVDNAAAAWDRLLGRADEVRRPEPGSRREPVKLPSSRDFR